MCVYCPSGSLVCLEAPAPEYVTCSRCGVDGITSSELRGDGCEYCICPDCGGEVHHGPEGLVCDDCAERELVSDPVYQERIDAGRDAWMAALDADPGSYFTPVLSARPGARLADEVA